jgi:hypothetical protein
MLAIEPVKRLRLMALFQQPLSVPDLLRDVNSLGKPPERML